MGYREEPDILKDTAKKYFNINYLYPYQRLVITNILEAAGVSGFTCEPEINSITGEEEIHDTRNHQIVILPTGAGKSLCYMIPSILLKGPTLAVFPLLSLISDQERRLSGSGINPVVLRGGQSDRERTEEWKKLERDEAKIILTNPETALSESTLRRLWHTGISHLVIDEMHVVSEWGDTFRPAYRKINRLYTETGIKTVTAFTATASPIILKRVKEILFPDSSPAVISADPDRPNIRYRVIPSVSKKHDLAVIIGKQPWKIRKPAIIFNRSRTGAELTAAYLRRKLSRDNIFFYHAGLDREEKKSVEDWFFSSKDGILSSTCAYGMGLDKKNIRTVVHIDPPPSVEAYLQESGRAGRDGNDADAILLVSRPDFLFGYGIKDSILRKRYLSFLTSVTDSRKCRRKALLNLLGTENESCNGCDVCSRDIIRTAAGSNTISSFLKHYPVKAGLRNAVIILSGKMYPDTFRSGSLFDPYFGLLEEWSEEEIEEALNTILEESKTDR